MTAAIWDHLLSETRAAYLATEAMTDFAPFPDDLMSQPVEAYPIPSARLLAHESGLFSDRFAGLRDAFVAAAPLARWRETYKGTDIGRDFLDRFGCFSLIGAGGAYMSRRLWTWVVYMPPGLHYPWHHHPGEEIYMVLAGEAEFLRWGKEAETLRPGDTSQHGSNQPHAMTTHAHPVLCLVAWRNGFATAPVLTSDDTQPGHKS